MLVEIREVEAADGSSAEAASAASRAAGVVTIAGVVGLVAMRSALRPPEVKRVEHRIARWPRALDGFRIV